MTKIKKPLIVALVIILILAITNPDNKDFSEWERVKGYGGSDYNEDGRISYFGIFSTYKVKVYERYSSGYNNWICLGIFKNFILITIDN